MESSTQNAIRQIFVQLVKNVSNTNTHIIKIFFTFCTWFCYGANRAERGLGSTRLGRGLAGELDGLIHKVELVEPTVGRKVAQFQTVAARMGQLALGAHFG